MDAADTPDSKLDARINVLTTIPLQAQRLLTLNDLVRVHRLSNGQSAWRKASDGPAIERGLASESIQLGFRY